MSKDNCDKYKKRIKYLNTVIKEQSDQMLTLVEVIEQMNKISDEKVQSKNNRGLYVMSFVVLLLLIVGIIVYLKK